MAATEEVIVWREGRAGRLTLNRPKALNALTYGMVNTITAALQQWADDPAVELVILDGAGDRGLCAGGDVRWLYDSRASGTAAAEAFWRDEYVLNDLIARYGKPFVALMDGIVMGGGIGLSGHAAIRVVTERSQLAMPETAIGLIPDVGGTWLLSRAQGKLGIYLGLTGTRMSGSDAIQAGFADHYIPAAGLAELCRRLAAPDSRDTAFEIVDDMAGAVPASPLAEKRTLIDRLFAGDGVQEILRTLLTTTDDLALKARADMAKCSPIALVLTHEAIRRARTYASLREALDAEFRLCTRLYEAGEFNEGVRALLVDKDKSPRWNPARIEDVGPDLVAHYFAP
jgi:enoyl-CoA hydratase